jgi:hypothetical protein
MCGETRQSAQRKVLGLHVRAGYNEKSGNDLNGHRFRSADQGRSQRTGGA